MGKPRISPQRSHSLCRWTAAGAHNGAHRLEGLEPYEGKLSSTVPRGGRAGNSPPPLGEAPQSQGSRILLIPIGKSFDHNKVNGS
jgi:hypothetical protein